MLMSEFAPGAAAGSGLELVALRSSVGRKP